ncbi:MAG: dephospho-CoA kinase [Nitrosomonadales bacterium]|nr:dephospho-CoA kinase [Nitrosomonadales bacterium]
MTVSIGLTGGIGSGKSTVAALFRDCGVTVIDSDVISHQLTQSGGGAIAAIRAAFGDVYIDASGALDRQRMRQLVFSAPAAKQRLEGILHPLIRARMLALAQASNTDHAGASPYLLLVVPLLFETQNYRELVQRTLVVDCAEAVQVARAMRRSGLGEPEVRAIMAQQIARAERLRRADDIIQNDGDMEALRQQVERLHQRYLVLATGSD